MPKDERQRSLDVLGLERNASKNDIRLAFFKKSLYTHPDAAKNNSEMASFSEVTQAFCNLSDGSCQECSSPDQVFFKVFQELLKDESPESLRAMLQENDAAKSADDEYRCDEDDNEIDAGRDMDMLLEIMKNRKKKGKDVPEDMMPDKITRCRDNLIRQREEAKKDPKKQVPKKGKQQAVPVSKPKPKTKKQLLAEQRRREKEMEKIAVELEKKKKEDEEKEKIRKQMEAEKQKRLEEERKKTEAEARRQREREQKERERLQKLEQERERRQKEEEERRKKEEMKRKKVEQERIEKEKAEKAAKIKAAQQAAKEKEEQAKNNNKNQSLKRNQPQRNDQTYPREIPPRFQRRMKQQQQQQQTVFPQQVPTTTSTSQLTPVQVQAAVQSQQTVQNKAVSKPTPAVGKKKDPQRWTKGEYTGIIEDVQDDSGWSKAPPAKSSGSWEDTTEDWGCEGTSWDEKPTGDERVIVDKTDQDSWPTVGGKGKNTSDSPENVDEVPGKECMGTFGDSLDAVIDGMEAAEEAAGGGLNSAKWDTESSRKDTSTENSSNLKQFDKGQAWSKTPGKDVKLKEIDYNSENLSYSWDESSSKQTSSSLKQTAPGCQEQPETSEKWKAVGNPGNKTETAPDEETGWGESSGKKRNSGSNWGTPWSAQGLSLTGTEIWDQSSADAKETGDKGSDWSSEDSKGNADTSWVTVEQSGGDDGQDWDSWSTAGSKRNKPPKPNPGNDENAWLRRSLKQLVDMGFKEVDGEKALKSNNMSVEAAISQLLGGQGTPPGHRSPLATSRQSELSSEATALSQTDEQDTSSLNRKQRRRLMQQNEASKAQEKNSEPFTAPSEVGSVNINMPVSSTAVTENSRVPISSERPAEYGNESIKHEQLDDNSDSQTSSGHIGNPSKSGSGPVTVSSNATTSASLPNPAPVRAPLPTVYQQQLLQQQAQLQQLRLAQATGLLRNPLASQPVILLRQLSQLRLIQQQLANQQQLLQKQPQANSIQTQQLALQQQQIGGMMQQIQQQLLQQQQQLQQQTQQQQLQQQSQQQQLQQQSQQQIGSNQFPTAAQQTLLTAQPQLQQLLAQKRKQQQHMAQPGAQTQLPPQRPLSEHESNPVRHAEECSTGDMKSISPRSSIAKEPTSLVQVVNSAPASPSTKSRLGQWTQNSIQTERHSPKPPESGGRDRNLRASPQPDTSLLITRSTNSPNSIQTTSNSAPVHRVLDPVSSKWGIDAGPKLSVGPPEFKPGVPWRHNQGKTGLDNIVQPPISTAPAVNQEWSRNSIGSQTVSSTLANTTSKTQVAPLKTVPNSQNFSQNASSAIWQAPASRQAGVQRPSPLTSSIGPPPGLGNENSFLNLPDMQNQSTEANWSAHSEAQITSGAQFGIRAPGFQPWPSERRDVGWPGTSGQPLDTLPSVPRANELRNLAMLGESTTDGNSRNKPELTGQQHSYSALTTWLVIRNINPRVDSTALRSLCQQHGPLLTFQLNLRYGNSLIRYGNKEEALQAHASLNGLVLAGSRLTADFATDSDIGSFFEQNSDWSTAPAPITTWANAPASSLAKTEPNTQWPGSKPLLPPANFSSELWSYSQAGGLAGSVWSTPPTSRRDGEQSTTVTENGITSPSMVTFLPPGLLNSGEST